MIDLKKTVIEIKKNGELDACAAKCYLKEAEKQGLCIMNGNGIEYALGVLRNNKSSFYLACDGIGRVFYRKEDELAECRNFKKITHADIGKRTKTEFVKCSFIASWAALKTFEEGDELYLLSNEVYIKPQDIYQVVGNHDNLYRKVEREVTWQDEVNEFIAKSDAISLNHNLGMFQAFDADSVECCEFIRMCHLVAEMTDKPE